MQEMIPIETLRQINKRMDAVFVDAGGTPEYLPDLLGEIEGDEAAENDPTRVITEEDNDGTIVLQCIDEQGFRGQHYGTVYSTEQAEALGL